LRELGVALDRAAFGRLFELARAYDDVLLVEFDKDRENMTVAVKLYDRSRERIIARNRVARITIPLFLEERLWRRKFQGKET
jgi:hypothetical protein